MAIDTLNGVTEVGGFKVGRHPNANFEDYIVISEEDNAIGFKLQNGPIKEVGVNGCQVDTMIETVILILSGFNDKFPCEENAHAIECLKHAIFYLEERKMNREARKVEGQSLP
jgi:hypothetical protein